MKIHTRKIRPSLLTKKVLTTLFYYNPRLSRTVGIIDMLVAEIYQVSKLGTTTFEHATDPIPPLPPPSYFRHTQCDLSFDSKIKHATGKKLSVLEHGPFLEL